MELVFPVDVEMSKGDVTADDLLFAIDAKLLDTRRFLEGTGELAVSVNDLIRDGGNLESRGKLENPVFLDYSTD